jgi:hypothetical protein
MIAAVYIALCGMGFASWLLMAQQRAARTWARELKIIRLHLPANLDAGAVARWLGMVAASTSVPRWSRRPPLVLGMEVRATARGIKHLLLVPKYGETTILQTVRSGLPGVRLEAVPASTGALPRMQYARELALTSSQRSLAIDRAEAVATAFLTTLHPLAPGQEVRVTWYFAGAGVPIRDAHDERTAEERRAQRTKAQDPLLLACLRIGARAGDAEKARALVSRATASLRGLNAPGVRLVHRWWLPVGVIARRVTRHALPLTNWMLLNSRELSGLVGIPIGETFVAGLSLGSSRQLPPSPSSPRSGLILARSTYPGSQQALRQRTGDRLAHTWLLGPTGVGKSTLIANMALQDARAGHGFALVDPKADLVEDILTRLPESRRDDVVVLDPAAATSGQLAVGFNLLDHAQNDHERELVVDHVVHIMHSLWADSWGPRTSDVLRNSLLTLTHTKAMDGSTFTLIEVAELLENAAFRRFVTSQPTVPKPVRSFWAAFERLSEQARAQIIAPSQNKLRALSTRSSLRLILGQSSGINVADVFTKQKILLVPLSKGTVGVETAQLLGSLVVASLIQVIFARSAVPAAKRKPAWIYLDEFQDVLRLDLDIADALSQARAMAAGFVLANQYMGQLTDTIKRACLGTVRSTVLFQLDYDDARLLERRFAPLTATDLMHLPVYEIAARLCEYNTVGRPVTGATLPLPEPEVAGDVAARASRGRYGQPRPDVEAAIRARITPSIPTKPSGTTTFGRRKLGGAS